MKKTIITVYNRDASKSFVVEFNGDISVIVSPYQITVTEYKNNQVTKFILNHGQYVNVRNWGTK